MYKDKQKEKTKKHELYLKNNGLEKQKIRKNRMHYYINILQQLKENGCDLCGYNKNMDALDFHHVEPKYKEIQVAQAGFNKTSIRRVLEERSKCILVCKNCHVELTQLNRKR